MKEDGFTSQDDESENIVNILSDYDQIVEQIYGSFDVNFLNIQLTSLLNEDFKDKFEKFKNDHLVETEEEFKIPNVEDIKPLRRMFACQDAMLTVENGEFAESLAQQVMIS